MYEAFNRTIAAVQDMRQSEFLIPTLKEEPKDAQIASHRLMLRAGMIRQLSAGIYIYMPLLLRVFHKVEQIIREEMEKASAQELLFPSMIPSELWKKTKRWDAYGDQLLKVKDRLDRDYCYGPTHEEVVTDMMSQLLSSYKQLPVTVYQIQAKFRDELRPRFGLMRGREFSMKDAYSFHADSESLNKKYEEMKAAYKAIFRRFGLDFKVVDADVGDIGGHESAEFMVTSDTGEDEILESTESDFAANIEAAPTTETPNSPVATDTPAYSKVHTPDQRSIDDLVQFLSKDANQFIKSMLFTDGDAFALVLLRGDHNVNECKFKQAFPGARPAYDAEIEALGLLKGFIGPVNLPKDIKVYADHGLNSGAAYYTGANETDYHFESLVLDRDLAGAEIQWGDYRLANAGDPCPAPLTGEYRSVRGIEVGHIFKLGTRYSEDMSASFLDANGKSQTVIMGTYGIGVGRSIAAAIEQHHDEKGISWPAAIAPFTVHLLLLDPKKEELTQLADSVYETLQSHTDVLYDDRMERAGIKFKDADLIGIPIQVRIGKRSAESQELEVLVRRTGEELSVPIAEIGPKIAALIEAAE